MHPQTAIYSRRANAASYSRRSTFGLFREIIPSFLRRGPASGDSVKTEGTSYPLSAKPLCRPSLRPLSLFFSLLRGSVRVARVKKARPDTADVVDCVQNTGF